MESIIIVAHIIIALAIIGLILMQQGKGAEAGASFGGGASQTVFGSQGGGNFFAKLTAILAFLFFASSFTLTILAKNQTVGALADPAIPVIEVLETDVPTLEAAPEESDIPVIDSPAAESDVPTIETPASEN